MWLKVVAIEDLFNIFFVAIIVDFVTGILVAAKRGRLKSRTCSNGMFRSIGECIVLMIFILTSYYIPDLSSIFKTFILGFIFKECLSITENLVKLDVWIPDSIKRLLDAGIEKIDKKEGIK